MKLTIKDGRDHFYTFDTNRILILTASDEENIRQVEFSTEENGEEVSWTSEVLTGSDGVKYVQVPNEFLNGEYSRLVCYYVALDSSGEFTRQKEIFRIRARQEPQDYYLTYSERVTFASIKALTEQYKTTTKQYMDTTEGFKDNAGRSAELASKYAENNEDVAVEPGKYSAKHWYIKAEAAKETAVQKATEAGTSEGNAKTYMESAQSAKQDAVTAKNAANTILEQVQSKGTEITNFVATSKADLETQKNESVNAVKSVYQTDLNELKGDSDEITEELRSNKIIQFEPKIEYLGKYLVDPNGTVNANDSYYAYSVDLSKINEAYVNYANVLGYFESKPKLGSVTSDGTRYENYGNFNITVTSDKKYLLICNIVDNIPIVKNAKESETIWNELNNTKLNVKNLESTLSEIIDNESEYQDVEGISIAETYYKSDGTTGTGGYSISCNIKSGETYRIKAQTGSSVLAYVIKDSANNVTRYTDTESWGTNHNYDVNVTISSIEDGGTIYVNSIRNDYIGLQRLTDAYYLKVVENKLIGKTIVFDGDSICHATSERTDGKGGWAYRIGNVNRMNWHNVGISGGTITSETYGSDGSAKHWLSSYIDTIHQNYPELDYLILEGGTNDADIFKNNAEKIGTLNLKDYSGNYDKTTFCGALDTLFYKAITYYPNAKIGFIIAHRMYKQPYRGYDTEVEPTNTTRLYFDLIIKACKKWGIPFIDLWYESSLNPMLLCYYNETDRTNNAYTDGQHLTAIGYDIISPKIESWIRTL